MFAGEEGVPRRRDEGEAGGDGAFAVGDRARAEGREGAEGPALPEARSPQGPGMQTQHNSVLSRIHGAAA